MPLLLPRKAARSAESRGRLEESFSFYRRGLQHLIRVLPVLDSGQLEIDLFKIVYTDKVNLNKFKLQLGAGLSWDMLRFSFACGTQRALKDGGNALLPPVQRMVKDNLERAAMVKERRNRLQQAEVELP